MAKRRYVHCDVFSSFPCKGNGLPVVVDGEGLTTDEMQAFAAWTNQAETTFLLPPEDPAADYRVRIFTPTKEMLFAGHPTLGSCRAWLHTGGQPKSAGEVIQECAIGLVRIETGDVLAFEAPPTTVEPMDPAEETRIKAALGLDDGQIVQTIRLENGPIWHLFELSNAQAVRMIDASSVRWPDFQGVALLGEEHKGGAADFEIRNVSPSSGMDEDPITGSLNAAVAMWMHAHGRLTRDLVVAQGTCIGRQGRVYVQPREGRVLIGGEVSVVVEGTVDL